jgi:hypothetical protein
MTLKELIQRHPVWAGIRHYLVECYPGARGAIRSYEDVFQALLYMRPRPSGMTIVVDSVITPSAGPNPVVVVYGYDGRLNKDIEGFEGLGVPPDGESAMSLARFRMVYAPWEEWLGMEIDARTMAGTEENAIIAHCIKEMTWAGFDQGTIRQQMYALRGGKGGRDALVA